MPTKQLNVRLPDHSQKQLAELRQVTGMTLTQVIIIAISNLHTEFAAPEKSKGNK